MHVRDSTKSNSRACGIHRIMPVPTASSRKENSSRPRLKLWPRNSIIGEGQPSDQQVDSDGNEKITDLKGIFCFFFRLSLFAQIRKNTLKHTFGPTRPTTVLESSCVYGFVNLPQFLFQVGTSKIRPQNCRETSNAMRAREKNNWRRSDASVYWIEIKKRIEMLNRKSEGN